MFHSRGLPIRNRKGKRKLFLAVMTLGAGTSAMRSNAAVETWAPGGTTGGAGTWDLLTKNWSYASALTTWSNGNDATFGGSGGIVGVDAGGISLETGTFGVTGYTLQGGPITLTGTTPGFFEVGASGAVTADSVLSSLQGSAGAKFVGSSASYTTLTLGGNNTYTGLTQIVQMTLDFSTLANGGSPSSFGQGSGATGIVDIGSVSAVTINNVGVGGSTDRQWVNIGTSTSTSINNLGSGALAFNNTGAAVSGTGARAFTFGGTSGNGIVNTFAEAINDSTSSSTNVTVNGSIWAFTGTNTNTGTTAISGGGTARFGQEVSLYDNNTANWTPANIRVATGSTFALSIGGTGEFTASDVTTLLNNLETSAGGQTTSGYGLASGSNFGLDTTDASAAVTYSPVIANSTGTGGGAIGFTKSGTGILILSGANTYTGPTTISGGVLSTGTSGSLAAGGASSSIGASPNGTGSLILNGGTLQYANSGPAETTDRRFTLGAGSGTLDASGANSITFSNTGAIATASGVTATTLTLTGTGAGIFAPSIAGGSTINGITKSGTGSWVLTNTSAYTGVTTINGGTLSTGATGIFASAGTSSSIGNPTNVAASTTALVLNGGALQYANTGAAETTNRLFTLGVNGGTLDASGAATITFSTNNAIGLANSNSSPTLTFSGTGAGVFAPIIGNDGTGNTSVTQTGGNWSLTSANTYTGPTTISGGTLQLGGTAGAISPSSTITDNSNLTLDRSNNVVQGTDFSAAISGTGSITQAGVGTATFAGANTYSGGTTLAAGAVSINQSNSLGAGTVTFAANATLVATSALVLSNAINTGTLTTTLRNTTSGTGNTFQVSGLISGSGSVNLQTSSGISSGPIELSNDSNSFAGNFSTGLGIFEFTSVANSGAISSLGQGSTIAVNNTSSTSSFLYVGSGNVSTTRTFTWGGTIGQLTLGSNSPGSIQYLSTGTFRTNTGIDTLALSGTSTGNNVLAPTITDSGGATSLAKSGAGMWILTGPNTYSGATTISAGNLTIDASDAGNTLTGVSANTNAAIAGSGTITIGATGTLHLLDTTSTPSTVSILSSNALVSVVTGSSIVLDLSDQTQTVSTFVVNGAAQPAGTYGSSAYTGSATTGTDTAFFSGDGALVVTNSPEPSAVALLGVGSAGLLRRRRRHLRGV